MVCWLLVFIFLKFLQRWFVKEKKWNKNRNWFVSVPVYEILLLYFRISEQNTFMVLGNLVKINFLRGEGGKWSCLWNETLMQCMNKFDVLYEYFNGILRKSKDEGWYHTVCST